MAISALSISGVCKPGRVRPYLRGAVCRLVLATVLHRHDLDPNHPIYQETVLVNAFFEELAATSRDTSTPLYDGKAAADRDYCGVPHLSTTFPTKTFEPRERSSGDHSFSHRACACCCPGGVGCQTTAHPLRRVCQRIAILNRILHAVYG
ncbi:hypothetical protein J6590_077196 [Homalodisca vitripennis]|nr:hypothetical protein J6590_077196 [Homalodisca vitripennis]